LNQFVNNAAIFNKVLDSYAYDNNLIKKDSLSVNMLYSWPDFSPTYTTIGIYPSNINLLNFGPTKWTRKIYDQFEYMSSEDVNSNDADYYWSSSEDSSTHAWAVMAGNKSLSSESTPTYMDPDATAFLNAALITDATIQNAINVLVIDLKNAGIWTKMKAVYPMAGGSAATHKFNLKDPRDDDSAYRLSFSGGWTHSATGALSDGTTGWANTNVYSNQIFTANDGLLGIYTSSSSLSGASSYIYSTSNMADSEWSMQHNSGVFYFSMFRTNSLPGTASLPGFSAVGMETNGYRSVYKNGSLLNSQNLGFISMPQNIKMVLSARNASGTIDSYSGALYSFAFISSTLTSSEHTKFYTAVQKYQTSMGRQVGDPISQFSSSFNLDSVVLPKSTLCKVKPFRIADDTQKSFNFDADYAIITYKFSGERDLDTRTTIVSPSLPQSESGYGTNFNGAGWTPDYPTHPYSSTYSVIWHADDNRGFGYETVLINFQAFRYYYPGQSEIIIYAKAHWFVQSWAPGFERDPYDQLRLDETSPVILGVDLYKGGSPIKNPNNLYQWINPTAGASMSLDSYGKVINTEFYAGAGTGQMVAKFKYNVVGKFGYLFIND